MTDKHLKTHHAFLLLIGMFFVSWGAGSIGAFLGKRGEPVVTQVQALKTKDLIERVKSRRAQRKQGIAGNHTSAKEKTQGTPAQLSSLLKANLSEQFEVSLNIGTLSYPALNISAPIGKPSLTHWINRSWSALENQMQFGLMHGLMAYPHSPPLGGNGTIVVAGHSSAPTPEARGSAFEEVFASLPDAMVGDRIELRDSKGVLYAYEVYATQIVPPTQTSILLQDPSLADIILMTCYPIGTTRERFLVRARLVKGDDHERTSLLWVPTDLLLYDQSS